MAKRTRRITVAHFNFFVAYASRSFVLILNELAENQRNVFISIRIAYLRSHFSILMASERRLDRHVIITATQNRVIPHPISLDSRKYYGYCISFTSPHFFLSFQLHYIFLLALPMRLHHDWRFNDPISFRVVSYR